MKRFLLVFLAYGAVAFLVTAFLGFLFSSPSYPYLALASGVGLGNGVAYAVLDHWNMWKAW